MPPSSTARRRSNLRIACTAGREGYHQPKDPTLIAYDTDDPATFKWGGQVGWRSEAVQGVKLLLDPDQPKPIYLPTGNIKNEIKKLPKDPVDVAADFIGAIYTHALSKIQASVPKDYFLLCQKQFVLSVPAVWSDKAKDKTLRVSKPQRTSSDNSKPQNANILTS